MIKNIKTTYKDKAIYWQPILNKYQRVYLKDALSFYGEGWNAYKVKDAIENISNIQIQDIEFIALCGDVEVNNRNQYQGFSDKDSIITLRNKEYKELKVCVQGEYDFTKDNRPLIGYYLSFKHNMYDSMTEAANKHFKQQFESQLMPHLTQELLEALKEKEKSNLLACLTGGY